MKNKIFEAEKIRYDWKTQQRQRRRGKILWMIK